MISLFDHQRTIQHENWKLFLGRSIVPKPNKIVSQTFAQLFDATVTQAKAAPTTPQPLSDQSTMAFIQNNEGYRSHLYVDSTGHPSIGYGFKVADVTHDARGNVVYIPTSLAITRFNALGIALTDAYIKTQFVAQAPLISNATARAWFAADYLSTKQDAVAVAEAEGVNFDALSGQAQEALIDLVYNLGVSKMRDFQKMWNALAAGDVAAAGFELVNSKRSTQVQAARTEQDFKLLVTGFESSL